MPKVAFGTFPSFESQPSKSSDHIYRTIGGKAQDFPSIQTARRVGVDYTLAAANAFTQPLAIKLSPWKKLRFVFCSGHGAARDEDASIWIFKDTRIIKVWARISF